MVKQKQLLITDVRHSGSTAAPTAEVVVIFYASSLSSSLSPGENLCGTVTRIYSVLLKIMIDRRRSRRRRRMYNAVAAMMRPASVSSASATVATPMPISGYSTISHCRLRTYGSDFLSFRPLSLLLRWRQLRVCVVSTVYMNPVCQLIWQTIRIQTTNCRLQTNCWAHLLVCLEAADRSTYCGAGVKI